MTPLSQTKLPGLTNTQTRNRAAVMQSAEFLSLIRRMCADVGIADASEVIETQHVVVDGVMVGMSFGDGAQARSQLRHPSDHLSLYFDLGVVPVEGIERKLLKINASEVVGSEECFGIHPHSDAVVYRVHLSLVSHEGPLDLAHCIRVYLERGRARLRNLLSAELAFAKQHAAPAADDASFHGLHERTRA